MRLVTLRGITLGAVVSMALVHGASAADTAGAKLFRPADGTRMYKVSEVSGKVLTRGWPVLLVRADLPDGLWWTQDWAKITSPGHFTIKTRLGNDETRPGSVFRLLVVMAPSADVAKTLEPGKSFKELPADLKRSAEVRVMLAADPAEIVPNVVQSPAAKSVVGRAGEVRGRAKRDTQPVVLVRTDESLWWVQERSEVGDDGTFVARTWYGNDKTEMGTAFRVVVIMPSARQAQAFAPGMSMRDLPPDIPRSQELNVIRDDSHADPERALPVSAPADES